jgi:rhodanese-related sulfurtransferase
VNEYLQTSDEHIYAAGDMIEVENRVSGKRVRIPLAGPANRQGRIAAENMLGGKHAYKGAMGTSILRVFEAVAGITGLSLKQARALGIPANAVVVHKEHHTSYYPGAENVSVMLVYNTETGEVLGGQTAGYKGADRRLDVIASAIAGNLTIHDLADIDFAYSPPLGTANDAMNMAAFTAENKKSGFSNSITVGELDEWVKVNNPIVIDVRDMFAFEKGNISGAYNVPLEMLFNDLKSLPKDSCVLVYDETGKKGHQALRMLKSMGVENVHNISGGFISVQRQAYSVGFQNLQITLPELEKKKVGDVKEETIADKKTETLIPANENTPLVVDVRTPMEFKGGAYPNAINISLDELEKRIDELGNKDRKITLYCASGARSAYAQQMLMQMGFTDVENGGGLMNMMRKR